MEDETYIKITLDRGDGPDSGSVTIKMQGRGFNLGSMFYIALKGNPHFREIVTKAIAVYFKNYPEERQQAQN